MLTLDVGQVITALVGYLVLIIGWGATYYFEEEKFQRENKAKVELQNQLLATQKQDTRENEVWRLTVTQKTEDLITIANWLADGLRISRDYAQVSLTTPPTDAENWRRDQFRHLFHQRDAWSKKFQDTYALAFRIDPSEFVVSEQPTINLPQSLSALVGIMELLQQNAQDRTNTVGPLKDLFQQIYTNADVEVRELRKKLSQ